MKRRTLLKVLGALAAATSPPLRAQSRAKARIGFLGAASARGFADQIGGLRSGLKELGYIEGKDIGIEFRWAEGRLDRLPALAAELVRLGVDVLVTQGTPATRAAKAATTKLPIVMAAVGDAIVTGLVASLARPGGNVTGSTFFSSELIAKRAEILRGAMPAATRFGVMFNPDNPIQAEPLSRTLATAEVSLGVGIEKIAARSLSDLEAAINSLPARRAAGVIFTEEPVQLVNAKALTALAAKNRLATAGPLEFAPAGAVVAYGVHFPELYRRAAFFVDRILKGAKPADLPVEQAARFELLINLKSAKAVDLSIPAILVQRADRVIE